MCVCRTSGTNVIVPRTLTLNERALKVMMRNYTAHINISPLYGMALHTVTRPKAKGTVTPPEMHPSLTDIAPGTSKTWRFDDQECVKHGHIGELYALYAMRVMNYNKRAKKEVFIILPTRGDSDTQNNYTVKYNSRKLKRVTKPGGVKSFTIWRI